MDQEILKIGARITALPVVHGSGDFAWEVRRQLLEGSFDCLAVPLPESFSGLVQQQVLRLPRPSLVLQTDPLGSWSSPGEAATDAVDQGDQSVTSAPDEPTGSYVPIDPCQPVIAAIRTALGERLPIHFIDLETSPYQPHTAVLPDAWALKKVPLARFAAAVLPFLQAPSSPQWRERVAYMALRLRELSIDYRRIALVCSVLDWPWIRDAYFHPADRVEASPAASEPRVYSLAEKSLYFLFGELPYITALYERARSELQDDRTLGIDGIKELLLEARDDYRGEYGRRARRVTPLLLDQILRYARNMTLMQRNLTPQLVTLVTAAKQVVGDGFAISLLERARAWPLPLETEHPRIRLSIDRGELPDQTVLRLTSRLPGPPLQWTRLRLMPRPDEQQRRRWRQAWNPLAQCSWPPEDEQIERFRQSVFDRAKEIMGLDLVRTEKFTTSIKDGIDIRETLRNWYKQEIHVRELPPTRGRLDVAVMLFDSPADPRQYPWRTTWFAEHQNESTLAFYATNFAEEPVGPGICLATYGGAMFIYPPLSIPDIWTDPRLDFADTLEERLLAAACMYSQCPQIALVSSGPPGAAWRKLARHFRKTWIWLPLSRFSDSTIQQLRMVHVLNGKQVRNYAAQFIRKV